MENVSATAKFIAENLGLDVMVHLLPYHKLGISKHERLEDGDEPFADEAPSEEHIAELMACAEQYGLTAVSGG